MAELKDKAIEAIARLQEQKAQVQPAPALGDTPTKQKGDSPKSKKSRGVAAELVTTWATLNSHPDAHEILVRAAKHRGVTLVAMVKSMFEPILEAEWDTIAYDAQEWDSRPQAAKKPTKPIEEMTEDELRADIARLERQAAQALARMQAAQMRAANTR